MPAAGTPEPGDEAVRVLVSVGTDVHEFDRLVQWCDAWCLANGPGHGVLVQYGTSRPPQVADGVAYLHADRLCALFGQVDIVVCHGGPSTIYEARHRGLRPIVVPRDPALGEHVDDHQMLFVDRLEASGLVHRARSEADLADLIDRARAGDLQARFDPTEIDPPPAVSCIGGLLDALVAVPGPSGWAPTAGSGPEVRR